MKTQFFVMFAVGGAVSLFLQMTVVPITLVIIALIVRSAEMAVTVSLLIQGLSTAGFAALVKDRCSGMRETPIGLSLLGAWTGYMATALMAAFIFYVNVVTG